MKGVIYEVRTDGGFKYFSNRKEAETHAKKIGEDYICKIESNGQQKNYNYFPVRA